MADVGSIKAALEGRYAVQSEIGRGGMAIVYLATDERHGRDVAIKVLRPDLALSIGKERFLAEIEIAARLNHPHILTLIDSGEADGHLFFVMPFVSGESLRDRLVREKRLQLAEVTDIVGEVADALDYAHRKDLIHRDIKPENILFSEGHAVVTDFGIAKALVTAGSENLTRSGFPLGTPGYMSPEQAAGLTDLDVGTDVYGLACVTYEALVGKTPGMWLTDDVVRSKRFADADPGERALLDGLPGFVEQALVRALAMKRQLRFPTPGEFSAALAKSPSDLAFDENGADLVVRRAAELDSQETDQTKYSLGGLQRIAAEAGIGPEHIEKAADELMALPRKSGTDFFGRGPIFEFENTLQFPISTASRARMLEELRFETGTVGDLHDTLDNSLWWSCKTGEVGKITNVIISPGEGETRIRVKTDETTVKNLLVAAGGFGTFISFMIGGAILDSIGVSAGGAVAGAIAIGSTFLGSSLALGRNWFKRKTREQKEEAKALVDKLARIARGEGG